MKNVNRYRNFRQYADHYKNWNLFAGTKLFATDFFLDFINPNFNMKYRAETRSANILKLLICVSFICFVTYELLYHFKDLGIITLLCTLMHGGAYYSIVYKRNLLLSRILMELPMLLISQFSPLSLCILIIYDLMALHTWRNHAISIVSHAMLINIFCFISEARFSSGASSQTLVIINSCDLFTLMTLIGLELAIFAALERHLKESWVIKTSYEKSFRAIMSLIDCTPEKAAVVDSKGSIIFSNSALIECTHETDEHKISSKISSFIHKNNRDLFLKAINNSASCNMATTISIQFLKKSSEDGETQPTK